MDAPSLCEVVTVLGGVNVLESQISLCIPLGPVGILDDNVGEGQLGSGEGVSLCFPVNIFVIKAIGSIIGKITLGVAENLR